MQRNSILTFLLVFFFITLLSSITLLTFLFFRKSTEVPTPPSKEVSPPKNPETPIPSPVGTYASDSIPNPSSGLQNRYTLKLSENENIRSAVFTLQTVNGEGFTLQEGSWDVTDDQKILVTLTTRNGKPLEDEDDLAFNRQGTSLVLTDYDLDTWGSAGLTLKNQEEISQKSDPSSKNGTLNETSWEWIQTTMSDDTVTKPEKPGVFVITFLNDTQFGVTTDCNRAGGSYTAIENTLTFSNISSTKMACPGKTQEENFLKQLGEVQTFHRDRDNLILELKTDSGSITFVPYDQEKK